jgi:hypothetical protein
LFCKDHTMTSLNDKNLKLKAKSLHLLPSGLASILLLLLILGFFYRQYAEDKMMIIIIDGARYTETFGDPNHTYVSKMWNLSTQGTYASHFYNDSLTYTSRAIPALWCGTWTGVRDTIYNGHQTQYAIKPSIFEYYRKQKSMPVDECFYVLKSLQSLWLPSFNPDYGPPAWPNFHSQGSSDDDVADQAQYVLSTYHPHFIWVYLADVDGAGHSGNWQNYVGAIQKADSIVGLLWNYMQADTFYQNSTYMFVTNDHGRHDDQHGGFSGHGDGCIGCRHIMFLALGPGVKQNYVSTQTRRIPDMTVTACEILGINPEYATGEVMGEIMTSNSIGSIADATPVEPFSLSQNYPNPFNAETTIDFSLKQSGFTTLAIYNTLGEQVAILISKELTPGSFQISWNASTVSSGVYYYILRVGIFSQSKKLLLMK